MKTGGMTDIDERATERAEAAALVQAMDEAATKYETACGEGQMVWRTWGSGEPVVLLHGGSGSWTHWIKTIPELAEQYEVWAPDLPGLGDSAMPPSPHGRPTRSWPRANASWCAPKASWMAACSRP